jgi:uncharacterized protein
MPRAFRASSGTPHDIAKSFAVGVFIGIIPGMGTAVALLAAITFRLPKSPAILGSLFTNPWTVPFIYAGSYRIGTWIKTLEEPVQWKRVYTFQSGWGAELGRAVPALLLGTVLFGLTAALISYGIVRLAVTRYQRRKHHPVQALLEAAYIHAHHEKKE